MDESQPKKWRKRRKPSSPELRRFIQQYARKSSRNDPNDRGYSRTIEKRIKAMKPEELDRLLRDEDTDEDPLNMPRDNVHNADSNANAAG